MGGGLIVIGGGGLSKNQINKGPKKARVILRNDNLMIKYKIVQVIPAPKQIYSFSTRIYLCHIEINSNVFNR